MSEALNDMATILCWETPIWRWHFCFNNLQLKMMGHLDHRADQIHTILFYQYILAILVMVLVKVKWKVLVPDYGIDLAFMIGDCYNTPVTNQQTNEETADLDGVEPNRCQVIWINCLLLRHTLYKRCTLIQCAFIRRPYMHMSCC